MAQLKSTNILGNLAVTGNVVASSIKIPGATGFLKADGSIDSSVVVGGSLSSNTILIGDGGSKIKTSSKIIVTSLGSDDTTLPTSKAVKTYVDAGSIITNTLITTKHYIPFVAGTSGTQALKAHDDLYYTGATGWSSFNIGYGTKNGILTLHRYTDSDHFINLQPGAALGADYTISLPSVTGPMAVSSTTPIDNEIVRFDGTTGKIQTSGATINDSGDITAKRYLVGTWLQTTANNASGSAATKICVQDSSGWLYTRTPSQICSDINALPKTGGTMTGHIWLGLDPEDDEPVSIKGPDGYDVLTLDTDYWPILGNINVPTVIKGEYLSLYNTGYVENARFSQSGFSCLGYDDEPNTNLCDIRYDAKEEALKFTFK